MAHSTEEGQENYRIKSSGKENLFNPIRNFFFSPTSCDLVNSAKGENGSSDLFGNEIL